MNTISVATALLPGVVETGLSHWLNRTPIKGTPSAHISYHEGLRLVREFLDYSSKHTVEDIQAFTAQWVPAPHWVRINDAEVAPKFLERAAKLIQSQLGNRGLDQIGGKTWWQWRRPETPLRAEWIEMKKEYHERKRTGAKCERVILYVHGGAYYFGSVDEHRYQMQRHARKLRARVLAPRYRVAPQFPFPCGLYDCLATYYYLLEHFDPSQILFAGDSAGGGMVLSMLVTLRDQGEPLPAGTILLSPWSDLTHSFPSVAGDGNGDYIPPHGFHHRPSMAWPPPPSDKISKKPSGSFGQPSDAVELPGTAGLDMKRRKKSSPDGEVEDASDAPKSKEPEAITALPLPAFGHDLSIMLDGKSIDLKEQIQMYTTNELLAHPLVSPVMQPSLGGLPPMLIQVGGAELLKDEQVYLAHKAANPKAFPTSDTIMREFDPERRTLEKYPPTDVQLQVWEDLCHVPHTLSFTRPAKYMYRSVAQFGAWALSRAQKKGIDIQNDDAVSIISSGEEDEGDDDSDAKSTMGGSKKDENGKPDVETMSTNKLKLLAMGAVGKAGDPLPSFKDHMIRQRVTRHGVIFPLPPPSEMASLALDPASIGVIKPGPVRKWLATRAASDQRFANEAKKVQKKRAREAAAGYDDMPGENPPPTALVNRRRKGVAPEEKKRGKSWGLAMWSGWGSSHDEHTLQREQKNEESYAEAKRKPSINPNGPATVTRTATNGNLAPSDGTLTAEKQKRRTSSASMFASQMPWSRDNKERPRSPYMKVNDTGQADDTVSSSRRAASPSPSGGLSPTLARRTSATSSFLNARPVSAAADSPIPIEQDRTVDRSHDAPIPVPIAVPPTTSQVSPDSEKIPGSENTYLSPTSSRPHNGVQAYPFKLRDKASNPSIATLDSAAASGGVIGGGSGVATPHSELAGDTPKPVELPDTRKSVDEDVGSAADAGVVAGAAAPVVIAGINGQRSVSDAPSPITPATEPEKESNVPSMPEPETKATSKAASGADLVSPVDKSNEEMKDSPVSPVDPSTTSAALPQRKPTFDQRTSVLGSIGPDGLPNAHHEFARKNKDVGPPTSKFSKPVKQKKAAAPIATATDEKTQGHSDGSDGDKDKSAAPFRVRNPVYDARDDSPTGEDAKRSTPTKEPGQPTEAVKAAPFKLRHTVYDPHGTLAKPADDPAMPKQLIAKREDSSPSRGLAGQSESVKKEERKPSPPASQPDEVKSSAASSTEPPPSYDSMPSTTITMPETVATRTVVTTRPKPKVADGEDVPPTPPPKDDKPYFFKNSSNKGGKRKPTAMDAKTPSDDVLPKSKFSAAAPAIGTLDFEKKASAGERPGLEKFVTASEGKELRGS